MDRIKRRTRADRLSTELRSGKRRLGRWIYLSLLALLGLWLLNFLFGDYVYLQAEGIVTQPKQNVGSPNIATVDELFVDKGDRVEAGDTILQLSSQQALQEIANLSTRLSEIEVRRQKLASRRKELDTLKPIAGDRAEALARLRKRREEAISKGLETERNLHDLIQAEYDAVARRMELRAERDTVEQERAALGRIADRLERVLERIESAYNDGRVQAPVDGRIANLETAAGSVVRPGDALMEIIHGEPFVLGYIESGALYQIREDQRVLVRNGVRTIQGRVSEILPISEQLPPEFQRAFSPARRSQVIRVRLDTDEAPPTYSRVEIVAANTWWRSVLRYLPW